MSTDYEDQLLRERLRELERENAELREGARKRTEGGVPEEVRRQAEAILPAELWGPIQFHCEMQADCISMLEMDNAELREQINQLKEAKDETNR